MSHSPKHSFPSAAENWGPKIVPIPPALEFPFPRTSDEPVDDRPPAPIIKSRTTPVTAADQEDQQHESENTRRARTITWNPSRSAAIAMRPKQKRRFITDRPKTKPKASVLRMRRNQTGHQPTALSNAVGFDDDDGSSSSEEESMIGPATSGRPNEEPQLQHTSSAPEAEARDGSYSGFSLGNDDYRTTGRVSRKDGRLRISVNETNNRGYLAHALGASLQHHTQGSQHLIPRREISSPTTPAEDGSKRPELMAKLCAVSTTGSLAGKALPQPKLNIVIMVIGSRGDIQPFIKVGKLLKETHGHRVRMATHPAFKKFVEQDSGLDFFSIGGDPSELMAFMVKNPGLVPSISTVRAGEIAKKREAMYEMFQGFWRACINATDHEGVASNREMMADKHSFVADAIIANPPCFAHVHCAERLGVPLHLMFTFPYSPTQQFPHPLANIKKSNVDPNYTNFMSYPLVEMMTWQGLGDLVNRFRVKTLGLEPVSTLWAPGQLFRLKVPYTYLWSPGLIPKPVDWGPEIDIAGFVFLDLASSFKPPETLSKFLDAGEPPVYIGFGSIVVDDPDRFTALIFEAVKKAGVRALVSKGWGGLGDENNTPENVFMLENTPHDWLFPRCSAVVHHGGAGTTAIGLKCGKPTMVVPFFGDQPFWGAMVAKAGAGAHEAVPYKHLSSDKLAEGISQCLEANAGEAAAKIAEAIEEEGDGAKNAVESFHRQLPLSGEHSLRCSVFPDRVAVWKFKRSNLRLSTLAAELLFEQKKITWKDLRLVRHYDWTDFEGPGEPVTGAGSALVNSATEVVKGVGGMPVKWAKSIRRKARRDQAEKKEGPGTARGPPRGVTEQCNARSSRDSLTLAEDREQKGELPNGGYHGAEKDLPEPRALPASLQQEAVNESALRGAAELPSARSGENESGTTDTVSIPSSATSDENLAQNLMEDTGHGIAKAGQAVAKVPMDLSVAIAQGFHNAPRLYGDSTVRTAPRISGFHSGLRAAGSEFAFGVYDGVTGLFLQPYHGARQHGAVGFAQGIGKGFGGFVLKDLAAVISPFAYTMKGVHKELTSNHQPTAYIRKARQVQGDLDIQALDSASKQEGLNKLDAAWEIVSEIRNQEDLQKKEGVKGRFAVLRDQQKQSRLGGYENVCQAQKVLAIKQKEREKRKSLAMAKTSGEGTRRGSKLLGNKLKVAKLTGRASVDEQHALDETTAKNTDMNSVPAETRDKLLHSERGGTSSNGRVASNGNCGLEDETNVTNGQIV